MERMLPLALVIMVIRCLMLRTKGTDPIARKGIHFKGTSLVISIWPIYLLSTICTLFRISVPFMSTPKGAGQNRVALWTVLPQLTMVVLLFAGLLYKATNWGTSPAPLTSVAALLLIMQHWILFVPVSQVLKKNFKRMQRKTFSGPQSQSEAAVIPKRDIGKAI